MMLSIYKLVVFDLEIWHTHSHAPIVGSTDCVCYATVGVIDPVTSALHIIIGEYGFGGFHDTFFFFLFEIVNRTSHNTLQVTLNLWMCVQSITDLL